MLHEVLLALLGHPGSIVQEILVTRRPDHRDDSNDNIFGSAKHSSSKMTCCRSFGVPESVTFLTATERAAINRIVDMGRIYRDLRQFVRLPPLLWAREDAAAVGNHAAGLMGEEDGLYMRALKNGVVEVLDEYARRVAEVEMDVMADPTLTIARIHAGVREVREDCASNVVTVSDELKNKSKTVLSGHSYEYHNDAKDPTAAMNS